MFRSTAITLATVFFLVTVSPLMAQFPTTPPPKLAPTFPMPELVPPTASSPEHATPPGPIAKPPALPRVVHKDADRMLVQAFGEGNVFLQTPIRLWIEDRGLAITAIGAATENEGFRLTGVALAFFVKSNGEARIKTVVSHSTNVLLKTQKMPTSLAELATAPIQAVVVEDGGTENSGFQTVGRPLTTGMASLPKAAFDSPNVVAPFNGVGSIGLRFRFAFDAKLPPSAMLPTPVKVTAKRPAWHNEDLAKVAELTIGEPIASNLRKDDALEATARMLAKMNHLNRKKTDGFMLELIAARTDLQGMPFRMGEECRTREEQARVFNVIVEAIHQALSAAKGREGIQTENVEGFWQTMHQIPAMVHTGGLKDAKLRLSRVTQEQLNRAIVAALTQIMMPESEHFRQGLARYLATIPHVDATKALANLALYSAEDEVRAAAIEGLKTRRERDYTETLLSGFDYPLPVVAKRAADALVKLERKDLVPHLVNVLDGPDPRLPVKKEDKTIVRELVKVNHHRNCALCHAPGNTENVPDGILTVAVPLTSEPLPKPTMGGGYQSTPPPTPDVVVRIDMTYLRQDFSLMMPVNDAHPWPEMQRFDFLVRERVLTNGEAAEIEKSRENAEPSQLSPYHRAALFALRELTGRDTEPTAAAWRKLLRLPAK